MSQPKKKAIVPEKSSTPSNDGRSIVEKKSMTTQLVDSKEKEYAALELLSRFGLSTRKVASFCIDDPKGQVIRSMLAKKWLCTHRNSKVPAFTRTFQAEHEVITLTALGLRMFYQYRGQDITYHEINPAKINYTHASHTLEGQIAVKNMLMHGLIRDYETERMIDPENKLGPKKFDLVVILNGEGCFGKRAGIEIELSAKYEKAMCETRKRICQSLMQTNSQDEVEYAYVFYFIEQPIMQRYEAAFSAGAKIYHWLLNSKRKYVKGKIDLEIPDYLAARILFFPIRNLKTLAVVQ